IRIYGNSIPARRRIDGNTTSDRKSRRQTDTGNGWQADLETAEFEEQKTQLLRGVRSRVEHAEIAGEKTSRANETVLIRDAFQFRTDIGFENRAVLREFLPCSTRERTPCGSTRRSRGCSARRRPRIQEPTTARRRRWPWRCWRRKAARSGASCSAEPDFACRTPRTGYASPLVDNRRQAINIDSIESAAEFGRESATHQHEGKP